MNPEDPCAVQWEMEYDCPPEQPEQPPDLVPVCELAVRTFNKDLNFLLVKVIFNKC